MFKRISFVMALVFSVVFYTQAQITSLPTTGSWPTGTLSNSISVALTGNVSPTGTITIPSGKTLNISIDPGCLAGNDLIFITDVRRDANRSSIFHIQQGGKLIINGASSCYLVIEGNGQQWDPSCLHSDGLLYPPEPSAYYYNNPPVRCEGELDFSWVCLQGLYNNAGGHTENYGTIRFNLKAGAVCNLDHVLMKRNVSFAGSSFYVGGEHGYVNVTNSTFTTNEDHHTSQCIGQVYAGGSIRSHGSCAVEVTLTNCVMDHNRSTNNGGAIYWSAFAEGGIIRINGGNQFFNNYAELSGGGAIFEGNVEFLNNNRFHHNFGGRNGGGISIEGYSTEVSGAATTINFNLNSGLELDNNVSPCGAGVGINLRNTVGYPIGSTINVNIESNIHDNSSNQEHSTADAHLVGGGVWVLNNLKQENNYQVNVNLHNANISNNIAGIGAGVYVEKAHVITSGENLVISNNKANVPASALSVPVPSRWNCAGGIMVTNGSLTFQNGLLSENEGISGAGAVIDNGGVLTMTGGSVDGNTASDCAGGFLVAGGNVNISGSSQFNNNTAVYSGGALFAQALTSTVSVEIGAGDNTAICPQFNNNSTSWRGGAIALVKEGSASLTLNIHNGKFDGNEATASYGDPIHGIGGAAYIGNADAVNIYNATITNNKSYRDGGAFYINGGHLLISDSDPSYPTNSNLCIINNNSAGETVSADGGAFYVVGGNVTISGVCTVSGNVTSHDGGAFYANGGRVDISGNAQLNSNRAGNNGGAVYVKGSTLTANGGTINLNKALNGGGVYVEGGGINVTAATIDHNEATAAEGLGGGFYSASGVTVDNSTVSHNDAFYGGGIYCANGVTTIRNNSNIYQNYARYGAGVYVNGNLSITQSQLSSNEASFDGGGAYANSGIITINSGVEVVSNKVQRNGGGLFVNEGGSISMMSGSISSNSADRNGGGVYTMGNFNLGDGADTCRLNNNYAGYNGGALYVFSGNAIVKKGRISGNKARSESFSEGGGKGGGIFCHSVLTLNSGKIDANEAHDGGAIFMDSGSNMVFTDGTVVKNKAVNGGGIYNSRGALLELYLAAKITNNQCYNNYDGGMGGGIYQNGTLKVAGNELKVQDNHSKNLVGTVVQNNVYLPEDDNFITIVDWPDPVGDTVVHGLSGAVWIGIFVPEAPRPVVHSDTPDNPGHLKQFYDEIHHAFNAFLKDDLSRYSAVYAAGPYPYTLRDIYFTGTWQIGALDLLTDTTAFKDGDLGTQAQINEYFNNIDSEGKLARFMCYVNGLNGYSYHPNQNAKVTADLYMQQYIWLPIGANDGTNTYYRDTVHGIYEPQPYAGTFDGGGHIISNLKIIALAGLHYYGLFGKTLNATIRNTFVTDCNYYANGEDRIGCIIGHMDGGYLYYSEGAGILTSINENSYMGGLVGVEQDNAYIHSCMAMPDMTGYTMGGLVGKIVSTGVNQHTVPPTLTHTDTKILNCFANPKFTTTSNRHFSGGLIGESEIDQGGRAECNVDYCYVRLDREHSLPNPEDKPRVGTLLGRGMIHTYMNMNFYPTLDRCGVPGHSYVRGATDFIDPLPPHEVLGEGYSHIAYVNEESGWAASVSNMYTYSAVSNPGEYYYDPAQDTYLVKSIQGTAYPYSADKRLLPQLQYLAELQNSAEYRTYKQYGVPFVPLCYWKRTGANSFMASGGTINGDYPILNFDSVSGYYPSRFTEFIGDNRAPLYIALGSHDGICIDYNVTFSDMLKRYNYYEGGGTINLFHSADNSTGEVKITDDDVRIYFDEGVNILQGEGSYVNAISYQTLREGSVDYWHTFSTVMRDSKIGIKYEESGEVPFSDSNNPCLAYLDSGNGSEPNSNNTLFPYNTPLDSLDFYAFYEPEYHWINFKRNKFSHWHMDGPEYNIPYTNETYLMPGKGYLLALYPAKKIYEYGVLNAGNITTSNRTEDLITRTDLVIGFPGYNLLGNPYQAYLDFDAFVDANEGLWNGSSNLDKSCYVYDVEHDAYLGYTYHTEPSEGSYFPSKYLAPHQGFFIVKSNTADDAPTTARFIETGEGGMGHLTGDGKLLRDEKPAYRLVNLSVRDEVGHADVASVEFGRPSLGGLGKQKALRCGDAVIYTRYENEDYAMLFLDEDVESLPLYFDCTEGGTYTLTWNTANGKFVRMDLVDNLTGVTIDCLSHDSYTFEAAPTDYKSRFKLVFQYAFDEEDEESTVTNFAFVNNGDLIVNGQGYLEVMDVNGQTLMTTRLTDSQSRVSIPEVAAGIYVIRLGEKTQKIVIR